MKAMFHLMVCVSLLVVGAASQEFHPPSTLQSLVDAERAFARASEDLGTRQAFLAYIAEDGVLFRPTAVNGKKWLLEHPSPPSDKPPLLAWQPVFADVAVAGDLGYTYGPWEYKEDIKDAKPVAYGHFATVWKKQADGSWKFVIDHGVTHPQPVTPATRWQLPENYQQQLWKSSKLDVDSAREALLAYDRRFSSASAARGPIKAFLDYSASDVRLFRNHNHPFAGADGIGRALAKSPANAILTWQPSSGDASQSGDLGYTHGTYNVTKNKSQEFIERGNYLRIWKKLNGVWKVMLDVADAVSPEVKN